MTPLPSPLLIVTNRHLTHRDLLDVIDEAVSAGAGWVWFRDKDLERVERFELARRIQKMIGKRAVLSIGADVDLACDVGVSSVHLSMSADVKAAREKLGAESLIGLSAHSLADVLAAKSVGANYVTLSPIFATQSKPGYGPELGLSALSAATALDIPILALGGIQPENIQRVLNAGASGVALMGAIICGDNVGGNVRECLSGLHCP
jgi:thiamine-phosphate pyrophosphorylase